MVYTVAQSYRNYLTMDNQGAAKKPAPERIRFQVQDEETGVAASSTTSRHVSSARGVTGRPSLARSSTAISEDSISIRPTSRSSMAIEPAAALPIQYRTL